MNKLILIPVKTKDEKDKIINLILSAEDFEIAKNLQLSWLEVSKVFNTTDNINAKLVFDQKKQEYKIQLILKELI